jgi:alpha-L-fucosidase
MKRKSVFTILFIVFAVNVFAKESKPISQLREEFLSWKFGMFIHFNMATFNEREWANGHEDPATFAPKKLDCSQWAEIAKMAHMQYAVLTVKHTGGWCLWDSDHTDTHDVTAFHRYQNGKGDIVQEYVDAFRKQGLKIGLYYCFPGDYTGRLGNPPLEKDQKDLHGLPPEAQGDYAGFIKKQLTELLTRYGHIDLLWIDQYRNPYTRKNWQEIRKHIKSLQPNCLIIANNSLDFEETDIHSYEYPWLKTKRPDEALPPEDNDHPAEVCDVLGPAWFWKEKENETNLKSAREVVDMLQLCNSRNANYLLNVAPDTSGLIPTHSFYRLQNVSNLLSAQTQSGDQSSLIIDETRTLGSIDLARFSLGQGGMSARPMFADHIDELKAINPPTIRFFIQEFYNLRR